MPENQFAKIGCIKIWGELPNELRRCDGIGSFPVWTPLDIWLGLVIQSNYEVLDDLLVETEYHSHYSWVSEADPSIMAQSWLWGSQITVKKITSFTWFFQVLTTKSLRWVKREQNIRNHRNVIINWKYIFFSIANHCRSCLV